MTDARDELVDAIAEDHPKHMAVWNTKYDGKGGIKWEDKGGLWCDCGEWEHGPVNGIRPWREFHRHVAQSVLAALVERFGEPEIEEAPYDDDEHPELVVERRLVFPWQAVKEGKNDATECVAFGR